MPQISPEEKRREAADWLRGLIGLALILGVLLIGYMVYQGSKGNLTLQQTQTSSPQKVENTSNKG